MTTFYLPDLIARCPLERRSNPNYSATHDESSRLVDSYNFFADKKKSYFIQGQNELLVSYTYPYAPEDCFRTVCDFINLLFVVDETSDDQSGSDARRTGRTFHQVMEDPTKHNGSGLAMFALEFRHRFMLGAKPETRKRFLVHSRKYVDAVAQEAELRQRHQVLSLEEFVPLRRENSAIRLCFCLIEYAYQIELDDEIFQHPQFLAAYEAGMDLVCWSNDLYSYNVEQAKGHSANNVVTVLMKENNIGLQDACDLVGLRWTEMMEAFVEARQAFEDGTDAAKYLDGVAAWIRGNLDWSFDSERYFGRDHHLVKDTLTVTLRPSGNPEDFQPPSDSEGRKNLFSLIKNYLLAFFL